MNKGLWTPSGGGTKASHAQPKMLNRHFYSRTLYIVNSCNDFKGEPWGSLIESDVTVTNDRNYIACASESLSLPFFGFNTATIWSHTLNDAHCMQKKSRGLLMILYLL